MKSVKLQAMRPTLELLEDRCVPALFPATLDLAGLNGGTGFALEGAVANDRAGWSVAGLGDVNGDGLDDLIVGASYADPNGSSSGAAYVLFGTSAGFPAGLPLSDLNGSNGFVVNGAAANDRTGYSVAGLGDINGDGIDDLIIGAPGADPNGLSSSGAAYVIFGSSTGFTASLEVSDLDGSNGFAINGIAEFDLTGQHVAGLGDVNGDGFDDLIVGAPNTNNIAEPGQAFVVFGKSTGFAATFELSSLLQGNGGDGSAGFVLHGVSNYDRAGKAVAGLGDVNGDGFDDLIVGAYLGGGAQRGQSYVVFGRNTGFAAELNLSSLDGNNGFALTGIASNDRSGRAVAGLGDVNGDGLDDLVIGAPFADVQGISRGQAYVVFGKSSGFSANFNLSSLDGTNGFIFQGANSEQVGNSVAGLVDINGDGLADLLVGAPQNENAPGFAAVIFGKSTGFDALLSPTSLDGTNGFILEGGANNDRTGFSAAGLGDVNGDGLPDLIVGATRADPNGESSGAAYVVFGRRRLLAVGPAKGNKPVQAFTPGGDWLADVLPYPGFTGGVRVAVGDVTGDGQPDVVMVPGNGRTALVQVWDGRTQELRTFGGSEGFLAYGKGYRKGAWVAVGDIDADGVDEIIVSPQKGPKRSIKVFEGDGTLVSQFLPYGKAYAGGVRVAVGNTEGTEAAEIITVKIADKPKLRVFDAAGTRLHSIAVKGSFVAVGDVDNDGSAEIIVGSSPGKPGRVRIYAGATGELEQTVTPYEATFKGSVRVSVVESQGRISLVTAPGNGIPAVVNVFAGTNTPLLDSFFAYDDAFKKGVFIAGNA